MMRMTRALLVLMTISTVGCASARLTMDLSIYRGDTACLSALTDEQLNDVKSAAQGVKEASAQLAEERKALAGDEYLTYEAAWKLLSKAKGAPYASADLEVLREYRAAHLKAITQRLADVDAAVLRLETAIVSYRAAFQAACGPGRGEDSPRFDTSRVHADLNSAQAAIETAARGLSGRLGTEFEGALRDNWEYVAKSLKEGNLEALAGTKVSGELKAEAEALSAKVGSLSGRIAQLADRGFDVAGVPQPMGLVPPERADGSGIDSARTAGEQVAKAVESLTAVFLELNTSDLPRKGRAELASLKLTSDELTSQIDRLQDPADPVWKVITDPEVEDQWGPELSKTEFYAEGNSSVVIVRDTVASYRVQRGSNNPAALVQGQLQVSRALAGAALKVAGAAVGVTSVGGQEGAHRGEVDAKKAAIYAGRRVVRRAVADNLRRNLLTLRQQIDPLDPKKQAKELAALIAQVVVSLEAAERSLDATATAGGTGDPAVAEKGGP